MELKVRKYVIYVYVEPHVIELVKRDLTLDEARQYLKVNARYMLEDQYAWDQRRKL